MIKLMAQDQLNHIVLTDDQLKTLIKSMQDALGFHPLKEQKAKIDELLLSFREILKAKHII